MRLIDADRFKKDNEELLNCDFPYLAEDTLEELIDSAPTVDAEPIRHGRWEHIYADFVGDGKFWETYQCSCCGHQEDFEDDYVYMKFCPMCGAKMDL